MKKTRQATCVCRNIELGSYGNCCSGNEVIIIYSGCVFVAFGIQCAMRKRHTVNRGLPGCTIFFHIILRFWREICIKHKMSSDFLQKFV